MLLGSTKHSKESSGLLSRVQVRLPRAIQLALPVARRFGRSGSSSITVTPFNKLASYCAESFASAADRDVWHANILR